MWQNTPYGNMILWHLRPASIVVILNEKHCCCEQALRSKNPLHKHHFLFCCINRPKRQTFAAKADQKQEVMITQWNSQPASLIKQSISSEFSIFGQSSHDLFVSGSHFDEDGDMRLWREELFEWWWWWWWWWWWPPPPLPPCCCADRSP